MISLPPEIWAIIIKKIPFDPNDFALVDRFAALHENPGISHIIDREISICLHVPCRVTYDILEQDDVKQLMKVTRSFFIATRSVEGTTEEDFRGWDTSFSIWIYDINNFLNLRRPNDINFALCFDPFMHGLIYSKALCPSRLYHCKARISEEKRILFTDLLHPRVQFDAEFGYTLIKVDYQPRITRSFPCRFWQGFGRFAENKLYRPVLTHLLKKRMKKHNIRDIRVAMRKSESSFEVCLLWEMAVWKCQCYLRLHKKLTSDPE